MLYFKFKIFSNFSFCIWVCYPSEIFTSFCVFVIFPIVNDFIIIDDEIKLFLCQIRRKCSI